MGNTSFRYSVELDYYRAEDGSLQIITGMMDVSYRKTNYEEVQISASGVNVRLMIIDYRLDNAERKACIKKR